MSAVNPIFIKPFHIQEVHQESHDVITFTLKAHDEQPIYFVPGQFNMLYAFGVGESAISISSDPQLSNTIQHTIRVLGSVTRNLHKLTMNSSLLLRGPYGTPWPIEPLKQKSILLLAGGIGLAPLRSLIYYLIQFRGEYGDIDLIYGARTPDDLIYQHEFERFRQQINLLITVDHAPKGWHEHVGVIPQHIPKLIKDPNNTIVLMCGPEVMMRFCYYALRDEGVPDGQIYLSMERNMQCAIGHCGHCQWGPFFICKDGPVMNFKRIEPFFFKKEL